MPKKTDNQKIDQNLRDSDADGLFDTEEKELGTDPCDPDTDHDALGDYQEVKVYGTNPRKADTDCDGVEDGVEVMLGRNPKGVGKLINLFIPNKCNNYRPEALHPKRLVFHAVTAIAIKLILVSFLLSFPIQAWLSPNILYEQSQRIVTLTNNLRASLNINLLKSSPVLQEAALAKAQDMLLQQYFAHLGPDNKSLKNWLAEKNYNFKFAGENLALGFSQPEQVVQAWTQSPTHYRNLVDTDFTEVGVAMVSGSYQGFDTALVAQYFGDPKVITPVAENKEVWPAEEATTTEENVVPQEAIVVQPEPAEEVLAVKTQAEPLAIPILISPAQNSLLTESLVTFKITAPQTETLIILDNDREIFRTTEFSKLTSIGLSLAEGDHNISLQAKRGQEIKTSLNYFFSLDTLAPVIDQTRTSVLVNQPVGQSEVVFKATAYLSSDTQSAYILFKDQRIDLSRDYNEADKWTGYKIIPAGDDNSLLNPIVLPSLTALDKAGHQTTEDINWQNIIPVKSSAVTQYLFLKQNPSEYIKPLFAFSSIYYKIILTLAVVAFLLNIFIKIRKQHLPTIVSSLGLIMLITLLTII
jgi:uncharacterized protein YkwD